jgi:hypothetical protein
MKTFALPESSRLKIIKTTPHKESHGDKLVQAVSLRLRWETTNVSLPLLHPELKAMLYWRPPQVDAQEELPDLPEVTPCLRVPVAVMPIKIAAEWSGYTLNIEHGIDDDSALELYVCGLSKFQVEGKEGGTVLIDWSLSSNKQITPELIGALCGLEGTEIVATLTPPAIAAGPVIDGTQEAFDADHPDAGKDAGELFAEQHAGDFGTAER